MSKIVQLVGHIASLARQFVGEERELTVDIESHNLRIHDGETVGGHVIPNLTQLDGRYQANSAALSYLAGLTNANKGIAVRVSSNNWVFRKVVGTAGQISVANETGIAGNITVSLPNTVTKAITWSGIQTFESKIVATGGVEGATTGVHTGNVVGNVTGNVEGDLTGDSEGFHTGGLDARGANIFFDNGQIPLAAIAGLTDALTDLLEPIGTIKIWNGTIATIPVGWHLCNGENGTPDYTNRFLLCVSTDEDHGTIGGAETHDHLVTINSAGAHTHDLTVAGHALTINEMPAHTHNNGVTDSGDDLFNHGGVAAVPPTGGSIDGNSAGGVREGKTTSAGLGAAHNHTATSASNGSHTHTNTVAAESHIPPYVAVLLIMRIA